MAVFGQIAKLTHSGSVSTSAFLSDVFSQDVRGKYTRPTLGVYVPVSKSVSLLWTGDLAKSYNDGALRKYIADGILSVAFSGTSDFAIKQGKSSQYDTAQNESATFSWVAPEKCTVVGMRVSADRKVAAVAANKTWTLAAAKGVGGNNMLSAATYNLVTVIAAGNANTFPKQVALTLTSTAADLQLEAGDVVVFTSANNDDTANAGGLNFKGLSVSVAYVPGHTAASTVIGKAV